MLKKDKGRTTDPRPDTFQALANRVAGKARNDKIFSRDSGDTPYRSRHAIFVQENAEESLPAQDSVPASISSRLLSVRAFNANNEIVDADVIDGHDVPDLIQTFFADPKVAFIHLHYARQGCFAASVTRTAPRNAPF